MFYELYPHCQDIQLIRQMLSADMSPSSAQMSEMFYSSSNGVLGILAQVQDTQCCIKSCELGNWPNIIHIRTISEQIDMFYSVLFFFDA